MTIKLVLDLPAAVISQGWIPLGELGIVLKYER